MPDGGLFPQPRRSPRNTEPPPLTNPKRGVVEIKPADYSLDALTNEAQTLRYLRQYNLVLITNLREFRLLEHNPNGSPVVREKYILARTPDDLWHGTPDPKHNDLLPDFLRRVLLFKVPLTQPKEVAWLLASYAREARARAEDHDLPVFRNVKLALEESLGIHFEGEKGEHFFRSTLVQTLFYGIFSAWVLWRHSPVGRVQNAHFNWRLSDDFLKVPILRLPGPQEMAQLPRTPPPQTPPHPRRSRLLRPGRTPHHRHPPPRPRPRRQLPGHPPHRHRPAVTINRHYTVGTIIPHRHYLTNTPEKALKARPIPVWGEAPGHTPTPTLSAEGAIYASSPPLTHAV